jgi:MerR family transcriptional regulator, light-induced transcriptional regulator
MLHSMNKSQSKPLPNLPAGTQAGTQANTQPDLQPTSQPHASRHRSGAVARMLQMPVATLRVWERRYGLTQPQLSPSGQRLYSGDDVRRLALLKQLKGMGHAIGTLAALDMQQLQRVAATHAQTLAARQQTEPLQAAYAPPAQTWRLAVIGTALGHRLQRPALLRRLGKPLVLLGPFEDAAQASAALQGTQIDALLLHEPQLHEGWLAPINAALPAFVAVPKAVLYGFAADSVCDALAAAGTALLREPQPDAVVGQWLHSLSQSAAAAGSAVPHTAGPLVPSTAGVPPRRWDDAALAEFAGLLSTVACECPRHVTELLAQLSNFEAYSAECEHRNTADAELHAYLQQVAADSRARFEAALEYVALHEGLLLPAASRPN